MRTQVFQAGLSLLLGLIFLTSSVPKLRNPKGFVLTVLAYDILPPTASRLYARLLPPAELFLALLLLTGTALGVAAVLAASLLASFVVAIGVNLVRGRELGCGCFGARERKVGPGLLLQDVVLGVGCGLLAHLSRGLGEASWSAFGVNGSVVGAPWAVLTCGAIALVLASILAGSRRRPGRRDRLPAAR